MNESPRWAGVYLELTSTGSRLRRGKAPNNAFPGRENKIFLNIPSETLLGEVPLEINKELEALHEWGSAESSSLSADGHGEPRKFSIFRQSWIPKLPWRIFWPLGSARVGFFLPPMPLSKPHLWPHGSAQVELSSQLGWFGSLRCFVAVKTNPRLLPPLPAFRCLPFIKSFLISDINRKIISSPASRFCQLREEFFLADFGAVCWGSKMQNIFIFVSLFKYPPPNEAMLGLQ